MNQAPAPEEDTRHRHQLHLRAQIVVRFEVARQIRSLRIWSFEDSYDLLPHLLPRHRLQRRRRASSWDSCQERLARFYMMFLVQLAAEISCCVRTAEMVQSSSDAHDSARQDAGTLWTTTKASIGRGRHSASDSEDERQKIGPGHFAYANGPEVQDQNSPSTEPNAEPLEQNSALDDAGTAEFHQMEAVPGELDESCTHSRRWRQAYSRHLPPSNVKTFHFADGSSAPAKVWRIPFLLGGRQGEVMSAEVETGSTPLLLSVTSMDSLGMDRFLSQRRAHIGTLGVDVEILMTRTKHRAIDLTSSQGLTLTSMPPLPSGQGPTFTSPNEDLLLYLTQEAAYQISEAFPASSFVVEDLDVPSKGEAALLLGARGVRPKDPRGELKVWKMTLAGDWWHVRFRLLA